MQLMKSVAFAVSALSLAVGTAYADESAPDEQMMYSEYGAVASDPSETEPATTNSVMSSEPVYYTSAGNPVIVETAEDVYIAQPATVEEMWIAEPATIVYRSPPSVRDSSGNPVMNSRGGALTSSGHRAYHQENAWVLEQVE
jgi:hypothetical protein